MSIVKSTTEIAEVRAGAFGGEESGPLVEVASDGRGERAVIAIKAAVQNPSMENRMFCLGALTSFESDLRDLRLRIPGAGNIEIAPSALDMVALLQFINMLDTDQPLVFTDALIAIVRRLGTYLDADAAGKPSLAEMPMQARWYKITGIYTVPAAANLFGVAITFDPPRIADILEVNKGIGLVLQTVMAKYPGRPGTSLPQFVSLNGVRGGNMRIGLEIDEPVESLELLLANPTNLPVVFSARVGGEVL